MWANIKIDIKTFCRNISGYEFRYENILQRHFLCSDSDFCCLNWMQRHLQRSVADLAIVVPVKEVERFLLFFFIFGKQLRWWWWEQWIWRLCSKDADGDNDSDDNDDDGGKDG